MKIFNVLVLLLFTTWVREAVSEPVSDAMQHLNKAQQEIEAAKKALNPKELEKKANIKCDSFVCVVTLNFQDLKKQNLIEILTSVRSVPFFNSSKNPQGIRVFEIKPDGYFAMLGLENGDIIEKVDDVGPSPDIWELDNRLKQINETLKAKRAAKLQVERNGSKFTYTFRVTGS